MAKHQKQRRRRDGSDQGDESDDGPFSDNEDDAQIKRDAEEIERYIEEERKNLTKLLTEFPADTKLTRRKAKELDHDIIHLLHLGTNSGDDADLKDLHDILEDSDDDDDEYRPDPDEEYHSDDPLSTTCSDIDSQPRTPADSLIHSELDDSFSHSQPPVQYDEDGLFKRPPGPPEPKTPGNSQSTISKRTRSKFDLITTDIETIEENFVPPDVPVDIYEADGDAEPDESWLDFLKEFHKPLKSLKADGDEEEEETDPEYVALPSEAADVEEVEDTPITEEEVNALLNALLDIEDDDEDEDYHCENEEIRDTAGSPPIIAQVAENPLCVQSSHIQPVALLHTQPELPPRYELILGADSKMYVLPRAFLRQLIPCLPRRIKRKEGPIIRPDIRMDITGDAYDLMEEIYDNIEEYKEYKKREHVGVFTESNFRRLNIQLLKHIQFLGMNYMQSYMNPAVVKVPGPMMEMLENLMALKKTSVTIDHLGWNLQDIYDLCIRWRNELDVDSEENREYVQKWADSEFTVFTLLPDRLREAWVTSKALIFSELLPKTPISFKRGNWLVPAERLLVVLAMKEIHSTRPNQTLSRCIAEFIRHYCPFRSYPQVNVVARGGKLNQAMTDYIKTGMVPEIKPETMEYKSYDEVLRPCDRPKGTLPYIWNQYVFSDKRLRRLKGLGKTKRASLSRPSTPSTPKSELVGSISRPLITYDYKHFKVQFNYDKADLNPPTERQPINLSVLQKPKRISSQQQAGEGKDKKHIAGLQRKSNFDLIRNLIHGAPKRSKGLERIRRRKYSVNNLDQGLRRFNEQFHSGPDTLDGSLLSTRIFNALKEFDIYARLLFARMKPIIATNSASTTKKSNGEDHSGPSAKRARLDDEAGVTKRSQEINKQYMRAQRMHDNNRVLLQPEPAAIAIERDSHFAWNFTNEVQRALMAEGRSSEFDEYLKILLKFNPRTDGIPDLYKKLEDLFLPRHADLLELFLSFLLPWHAASVGKFFEHMLYANMKMFIAKLRMYFDKQPNQLKKIHGLLMEFASENDEANCSVEMVKQRFLPLLKGNPLLIDWFNQLLPGEPPPEAQDDEFEELQTKNDLPFEEIPGSLITDVTDCPQTCSIKYMQGRIQYGNRIILPADLSFVATSYEFNCDEGGRVKLRSTEKRKDDKKGKRSGKKGKKKIKSKGKAIGCVHAISSEWDSRVDEIEEEYHNSYHRDAGASLNNSGSANNNNNTVKEEFPLCDAVTLKAHMNRLNPPTVDTSAGSGISAVSGEEVPGKTSPKKNHEWKTVPMYSKTKSSTKPTSPKKTAAIKGAAENEATSSNIQETISPKKSNSENKKGLKISNSPVPPEPLEEPEEIVLKDDDDHEEEDEETPVVWTREEDKFILESITDQQDQTDEEILDKLNDMLAGRSRKDINIRFQFLLNIVKQFHGA